MIIIFPGFLNYTYYKPHSIFIKGANRNAFQSQLSNVPAPWQRHLFEIIQMESKLQIVYGTSQAWRQRGLAEITIKNAGTGCEKPANYYYLKMTSVTAKTGTTKTAIARPFSFPCLFPDFKFTMLSKNETRLVA